MQKQIITSTGAVFLVSGLPAWAQDRTAPLSSVAASAPETPDVIKIPDPAWFVAGLVTGLIIGVIGAKVFGRAEPTN